MPRCNPEHVEHVDEDPRVVAERARDRWGRFVNPESPTAETYEYLVDDEDDSWEDEESW